MVTSKGKGIPPSLFASVLLGNVVSESKQRIATGSGNGSTAGRAEIRQASRARAPDSPSSSEGRTPERLDQTENHDLVA